MLSHYFEFFFKFSVSWKQLYQCGNSIVSVHHFIKFDPFLVGFFFYSYYRYRKNSSTRICDAKHHTTKRQIFYIAHIILYINIKRRSKRTIWTRYIDTYLLIKLFSRFCFRFMPVIFYQCMCECVFALLDFRYYGETRHHCVMCMLWWRYSDDEL